MNPKPKFDSITHFLKSGGFDYRIFDMGRKVTQISNDIFEKIESQKELYPYPFQQKAWIALLFWSNQGSEKKQPIIWFLQFPIDEMGFLKQEARDGFLIGLLEQTGKNIQAKQQGETLQDELAESPYAFKPQPDRLAMFHAFSTKILVDNPSKYYQHAHDYLTGKTGYEQWQFLGLQGIADVVARLDEDNNEMLLAQSLKKMPEAPLESFAQTLEHVQPKGALATALIACLNSELNKPKINTKVIAALVRSISGSLPEKHRRESLQVVLESDASNDIEVLVAISGRSWDDLKDEKLLSGFVNRLAGQNQEAFNAVLADLMMLPDMRNVVMGVMRNPERSEELNKRLNSFMRLITGKPSIQH